MTIQEQMQNDLKAAMRAGEKLKVEVIRMTLAAFKNANMQQMKAAFDAAGGEAGGEAAQQAAHQVAALSNEAMVDVVVKEVKRRREAVEAYEKANRADLAAQENAEAAILEHYMPRQLSADELRPIVVQIAAEAGFNSPSDLGKLMPKLMQQFKGQADGKLLSQLAREVLQKN
jgi:uncharacterized protein YqeY